MFPRCILSVFGILSCHGFQPSRLGFDIIRLLIRHFFRLFAPDQFLHRGNLSLDVPLILPAQGLLILVQILLRPQSSVLGIIQYIPVAFAAGILPREGLGVPDSLLNLILGELGTGGDGDLLLLAGSHIYGGNIDDAVGVNVEGHLDLGHSRRRPLNAA